MEHTDRASDQDQQQNPLPLNSLTTYESPRTELITEQTEIQTTGSFLDNHSPARKKPPAEVIFNVAGTKYSVVRSVGKDIFNWTLSIDPQKEWDIAWIDYIADYSLFTKLKPFQKISFFPGIRCLARKDQLGLNLMRLKRKFPREYDFFPETFILPCDYEEFRSHISKSKQQNVYIVKPQASCQGKGIFLTKTIADIDRGTEYVAQKYLTQPYLVEGLKFDMRIYVFLASCDPLKIYLYDDGLARFATEQYKNPHLDNLDDVCMHLTNYAINKNNPNFVFNNSATNHEVGHKRSIKALFKILKKQGHDIDKLWNEIKKIIIKTFCSGQPTLAHTYKTYNKTNSPVSNCFQIFGFDIMLDENLKPWLLEVNQSPSWTTDTPFDKTIKENVIKDALNILNVSARDRINYKRKLREQIEARSLNGRLTKPTEAQLRAESEQKQEELERWEAANGTGGYEKIFPLKEPVEGLDEDYSAYLAAAKDISPFRENAWKFPTNNGTETMKNSQLSPKASSKSPPMLFGASMKSPKYQEIKIAKQQAYKNSEQELLSKGTNPPAKESAKLSKEKKVKKPTEKKSAKDKKDKGVVQKIRAKPAIDAGDFEDLLEENTIPTSSGTSNKSVEQKEELVEKSPSKHKSFPTTTLFPRQLAASIFERLAAGKKQYAKISLHVPSNPSDAVHIDLSNAHKMILEKRQDEQRNSVIPKRFTQHLSGREFGKSLTSTQTFKSENASLAMEEEQEITTPSSVTPKAKKAAHTKDNQSYSKVMFTRESLNRPTTAQFGNYLMPKRFENAFPKTRAVPVLNSSDDKISWQMGDANEGENPIPISLFLKSSSSNQNAFKRVEKKP